MKSSIVAGVASVELAVTDLPQSKQFFTEVWGLQVVLEQKDRIYFRGSGPQFSLLSLRQAQCTGLVRITLEARDPEAVERAYRQVLLAGYPVDSAPQSLNLPGGGYGFGFSDPEGRNYGLVFGRDLHVEMEIGQLPSKITHVNLNSQDNDASFRFMVSVLDFKLSDQTRMFRFLSCNSDHHSLGLSFSDNNCLNHIAFEVPNIEALMMGIGRMRDHGYSLQWGPGRHGPGDNVFAYFCGPEELPIEYTTEVQQIDDSHQVRNPDEWHWPPGRLDQWGISPGPSERVKRSQCSISFVNGGYCLD